MMDSTEILPVTWCQATAASEPTPTSWWAWVEGTSASASGRWVLVTVMGE